MVAAAALLAARADVLAVDDLAGGVQTAAFVGAAVLGAQDGGGVRGDPCAGGDADGLAVGEACGDRVSGQDALVAHGPGARSGDGPAVHRGGVEGGQVGEGGQGRGQGEAEGRVEGHGDRGAARRAGGGASGPFGPRPGLGPGGRGVVGVGRTVRGGRVVTAGDAAGGAGVLPHQGERLLHVEVLGLRLVPRAGGGHHASGRVSGVASGAASGVPSAAAGPASALSSAQRSARAAALRAASATASGPPWARPAA